MTGNLNMGNNNLINCPTFSGMATSTSVASVALSTGVYYGDFDIVFTTWAETGDVMSKIVRSTQTIIDLRFYCSSAPISNLTFKVDCPVTNNNLMNDNPSLSAGQNFSAVFISTNNVPMDCGYRVTIISGRTNSILHCIFRYSKKNGQ